MLEFMWKCHEVVQNIMSCFAVGLGFQEDHFRDAMDPRHQDCGTAAYMNRYPSVEGKALPPDLLRIFAHTGTPPSQEVRLWICCCDLSLEVWHCTLNGREVGVG